MPAVDLSIVIPCYNEEKNIPLLVERLESKRPKDFTFELRFVDNGSSDGTRALIRSLMRTYPYITLTIVEKNEGYGWGIQKGLREAKGAFVCWTHADFQTDILDTVKAYRLVQNSPNPERTFVKGSRTKRSLVDSFFSLGNAVVATIILGTVVNEMNAQPNLFHRSFLEKTKPPKDWGIELYVYYCAKKRGYAIKRFPVLFTKRAHGQSNWNTGARAKLLYIKRAVQYAWKLRKEKF